MTLDSGHEPTEWESVPRPSKQPTSGQPLQYSSARHGSHVEESPELLRWRADLLMDEMMMGGVDVSAADGKRTFSGVDTSAIQRTPPPTNFASNTPSATSASSTTVERGRTPDRGRTPQHGDEQAGFENGSQENGSYAARPGEPNRPVDTNGEARNYTPRERDARPFDYDRSDYERSSGESRPNVRPDGRPVTGPAVDPTYAYREPQRPAFTNQPTNSGYDNPYENRGYENRGYENRGEEMRGGENRGEDGRRDEPYGRDAARLDGPRPDESARYGATSTPDNLPRPSRAVDDDTPLTSGLKTTLDQPPYGGNREGVTREPLREERRYADEQAYEEPRRPQNVNVPPAESARPAQATRPPLPPVEPTRHPAPPRVTPQPVDEHTKWATGADKWEYQDFSGDAQAEEEDPLFAPYPGPERKTPQESGVRHDPAQFVSAMSVVGGNKKRSTLLPRSTELDIDTLHREISELHGEIAALLPVGNETSERARHLLDKAYSILQSDPSRSAEVEYYMQQVRTIVQRLHQARQWSDLYRQRLRVYLTAWLGLSAVILLARFVFQTDMEQALMWLFGVEWDSWLVAHWATFVGTAFAGAFGGAIGALYTMQGHARGEYSFFDRKYGLRGLILPFMGLMVGAVGYVIFGLIFTLVGIDPSQSLVAAIVPTMAAFAFGFSQESIYGTRS